MSFGSKRTANARLVHPGLRLGLALVLAGALLGSFASDEAPATSASDGTVWLVDLNGPLGPATADLISRSIVDAELAGARAIIIRMDTPGGLDKSMRMLVKDILSADVPVITFVAPDGARAASAGTYIAYASHIAAMSTATNIGSSTPVSLAPAPSMPPRPGPDAPGDGEAEDEGKTAPAPQDAMTRKVINDAVAYLQGLAELRDRNIDWAEKTVREGANLRASEALEQNVIDLISKDVASLLADVDGWEVELPRRQVKLDVAHAAVHVVETDWKHELLEVITDPTIAYGLLIFGIYGLILEFYNPGMIFPSVLGVICLLMGAYGLQMLPINYAGLALIVVGLAMMIAEVFAPTMGMLGLGGAIAFVVGSLILMDTRAPGYTVPYSVIGAFALSSVLLTVFAVGAAVRARTQKVRTGMEGMLGGRAQALGDFSDNGSGSVRAFGEIWDARAAVPVAIDSQLQVVGIEGLTLIVEPASSDREGG